MSPPASVIVKWLRSDPSGLRMDAGQVVTERAALRFLSEDLGLDLAPKVIADDMAASLLVLEDLAPRTPLDRVLRRDGRRALARGVPEADDDRLFGFGLASACLTWAATRLTRFPALDARAPGENSRLQMVLTLDAAARAAEHHRALPHLAGWAHRVAQALRRRWPDADVDRTAYPAYTPRG